MPKIFVAQEFESAPDPAIGSSFVTLIALEFILS
jgi:hypothetical protein